MKTFNDNKRRGFFLFIDSLAHMKAAAQSFDVGMSWAGAEGYGNLPAPDKVEIAKIQQDMDTLLGRLGSLIAKQGES